MIARTAARSAPAVACWLLMLLAFVGLAGVAAVGTAVPGDAGLTMRVQDLRGAPLADGMFDAVAAIGSFEAVAGLAVGLAVVLAMRGDRWQAIVVAGVVTMRPLQLAVRGVDGWYGGGLLGDGYVTPGGGYPSGHVLGQVLLFGFLFAFAPRLFGRRATVAVRVACVALIALGALQRIYIGAHWPSETLGGGLLAGLYLLPVLRIDRVVRRRREQRLAREAGLSVASPSPDHQLVAQPLAEPAAVPASA